MPAKFSFSDVRVGARNVRIIKLKDYIDDLTSVQTFHMQLCMAMVEQLEATYLIDLSDVQAISMEAVKSIELFAKSVKQVGATTVLTGLAGHHCRSYAELFWLSGALPHFPSEIEALQSFV